MCVCVYTCLNIYEKVGSIILTVIILNSGNSGDAHFFIENRTGSLSRCSCVLWAVVPVKWCQQLSHRPLGGQGDALGTGEHTSLSGPLEQHWTWHWELSLRNDVFYFPSLGAMPAAFMLHLLNTSKAGCGCSQVRQTAGWVPVSPRVFLEPLAESSEPGIPCGPDQAAKTPLPTAVPEQARGYAEAERKKPGMRWLRSVLFNIKRKSNCISAGPEEMEKNPEAFTDTINTLLKSQ